MKEKDFKELNVMEEESEDEKIFKKIYDEKANKILTNIDVVCTLLKGCVKEYENLSKEEIVECLYLEKDGNSIKTLPNEDIRQDRGLIQYDVLFYVKLPNSEEDIGLYINLEAQNDINTGYPIINRAMYYASRLIARQKGETFNKQDYGKLKKVYSIWVCVEPKSEYRDTFIKYSFQKEILYAKKPIKDNKNEYDFINIIMLNIGDDYNYYSPDKKVLEFLYLIFKESRLKNKSRVQLLQDKYDIISLNKKEVENMITFPDAFKEVGKAEGIAIGRIEGANNNAVDCIIKLLSSGMELDKIYSILEPNDEVKKLVEEKLKNAN